MLKQLGCLTLLTIAISACGSRQAAWERTEADGAMQVKSPEEIAALKEDATTHWQDRANQESLEKAIAAWEQVAQADPKDFQTLAALTRGYYFLGDTHIRFSGDEEKMKAMFDKGVTVGERAMLAASEEFAAAVKAGKKVEEVVSAIPVAGQSAIYWYAVNLGKWASLDGFGTLLRFKDRIYSVMQHVLVLDENFFYAAPHRYFGAYYAKAPGFAGGDMTKSREHFEKAIKLSPNYLGTRVLFAELWAVKEGDEELFDELIAAVKAADASIDPAIASENAFEQQKANTLESQKEEIF